MKRPKLNHTYTFSEVMGSTWNLFLKGKFIEFDIPTELVITKPGLYVPKKGRAFITKFFNIGSGIYHYDEIQTRCQNLNPNDYPWSYVTRHHGKPVRLYEQYSGDGEDGHVDYRLAGYRFQPEDSEPFFD